MRTSPKTTVIPSEKIVADLRKKLKREKEKNKRQNASKKRLKEKNTDLKKQFKLTRIKNYTYPLEIIRLAVIMNMQLDISLRGVSKTLSQVGELLGYPIKKISHMTIRNWSLKLGQFFLESTLNGGKYVLIADESIEIGRERLLLLLLVPIEKYSPIVPLEMRDVKVLDLGVQESWKATEIVAKIKEKTEQYGVEISYGISDKCKTLRRAMKDMNISWIGDCTHEMSNISKSLFKKDKETTDYLIEMNKVRRKWILSKHRLLVPPEIRTKDRFQTMFVVHKWAANILADWEGLTNEEKTELQFVKQDSKVVEPMKQCYEVITKFSEIFKTKGIQQTSLELWKDEVRTFKKEVKLTDKAKQFISKMNDYLKIQMETLPNVKQILCCSDVIESMFGKYKNKRMKIITDDVLKITAFTKNITLEDVEKAMLSINTAAVQAWKSKNTTLSKFVLLNLKKKRLKMVA